jgi:hypothetical protein
MSQAKQPTEYNLLEIYVEEMEQRGETRNLIRLNVDDTMATRLSSKTGEKVSLKQIQRLADRCLANEWLEYTAIGAGKYGHLALTTTTR